MPRSKTSKRWLKEHFDDGFVKRAQEQGYRSRASFKLLEIQEKDRIIRPGMVIVDLGAAPGGWSQVAGSIVGEAGLVLACDILAMDALPRVHFVQGDFREEVVFKQLLEQLDGRPVDLVISDMAPNISGIKSVDQSRGMYLAELALDMARAVLKREGDFLVKVFQGEGIEHYRKSVIPCFKKVYSRKPEASRARSRETYLLARGYRGERC